MGLVLDIQSRLDWYSGSLDFEHYDSVLSLTELLSSCVSSRPFKYEKGFFRGKLWSDSWSDPNHTFLVGANYDSSGFYHSFVELHGSFLSQLTYHQQLQLDSYFSNDCDNFNPTRIDICLDDYQRRVSFDDVLAIGIAGEYFPYEKFKLIETSRRDCLGSAKTCYFGSSLKSVRFYDAEIVHGFLADRWELQLRDMYAANALKFLRSGTSPASLVLGSIIFPDLSGWDSLLASEPSVYSVPSDPFNPSLEKTLSWLEFQVAGSLAMVADCYGDRFSVYLDSLLSLGRSKYLNYHRALIDTYRLNFAVSDLGNNV